MKVLRMAEYILRETDISGEEENDVILIDEKTHEDRKFIDGEVRYDDKVVKFYRKFSKKNLNDEGTPVPAVKEDIDRLRIESDSESKHEEEESQILNHKTQEDDIVMSEAMQLVGIITID